MKNKILTVLTAIAASQMLGCCSRATDEKIDGMCRHLIELRADLKGASEEEAIAGVEEEFKLKEQKLQEEMARDLKGLDDVLAQKISDLGNDEEIKPEEKEERKKKLAEDTEKKKQEMKDQFAPDFRRLGPEKRQALRIAKSLSKDKRERADKLFKECVAQYKAEEISEKEADCRLMAISEDQFMKACE